MSKSRPRSTRSSWSPSSRARRSRTRRTRCRTGRSQPLEFPSSEPEGPQPFRVERRDGCTDITGPGIEKLLPGIGQLGGAGRHQLLRDRRRSPSLCRAESVRWRDLLVAVRLRFPDGVAEHLGRGVGRPVVRLADRDARCVGRRDVPVGARRCEPDRHALGPVAVPGDGPPGDGLDGSPPLDDVPPECDPVVAVGADGVAAVIPDPPVSEIRACVNALFDGRFQRQRQRQLQPAATSRSTSKSSVPESTPPPDGSAAGG